MPASFDLKQTSDQQFMFNLRAANSEIILTSERYRSKDGARTGIESVRQNAPLGSRYERLTSGTQYYFVLKAGNGERIGTSERYTTAAGRDNGITSVKTNAPTAPVREI